MKTNQFTILLNPTNKEKPLILTKKFIKTEKGVEQIPFDSGYYFEHRTVNIKDIRAFSRLLGIIAKQPRIALLRDQIKNPSQKITRRKKEMFDQVDRTLFMCDADKVEMPFTPQTHDTAGMKANIEAWVRTTYPFLRDTTFVVQLSSSSFLSKKNGVVETDSAGNFVLSNILSCHIWARFDKAICSESLKEFYHAYRLDAALAHPVQVHYTADPIFEGGLEDPFEQRIFLCEGSQETVNVADLPLELLNSEELRARNEQLKKEAEKAAKKRARQAEKTDEMLNQQFATRRNPQRPVDAIACASEGNRNNTIYGQGRYLGRILQRYSAKEKAFWIAEAERAVYSISSDLNKDLDTLHRALEIGGSDVDSAFYSKSEKKSEGYALDRTFVRDWTPEFLPPITAKHTPAGCFYAIHASMGTGKTHRIAEFCNANPDLRVLIVTPTQSLSLSAAGAFGAECYLEMEGVTYNAPRLSVCLDSVWRVRGHYDVVILDEFHQIAGSMLKEFSNKAINFENVFKVLRNFVQDAQHVFVSSANLLPEHLDLLPHLDASKRVEKITHISENPLEKWTFTKNHKDFLFLVDLAYQLEKKFVIFCASQKEAKTHLYKIQRNFPKLRVLAHHAEQKDGAREILKTPEKWADYDVVIFTTTAGTGVDFSIKNHFDVVFLDGANTGNGFDYTHFEQASKRVRYTTSSEVIAYIPEKKTPYFTEKEIAQRILKSEQDTLIACGIDRSEDLYVENQKSSLKFYIKTAAIREKYSVNLRQHLKNSLRQRGIMWEEADLSKKINQLVIKENAKRFHEMKEEVREHDLQLLVNAPEINEVEAEILQKAETRTPEDARSLKKFNIQKFYGDASEQTIKADQSGKTRGKINNRCDAQHNSEHSETFVSRDKSDLVRGKRSLTTAKHHALNARMKTAAMRLLAHRHPEINQFLPFPFELEEGFDILEETKKFKKAFPHVISKKLNLENQLEEFLGRLFSDLFGAKRKAKKSRVRDSEGNPIVIRTYHLDLEREEQIAALAAKRYEKLKADIAFEKLDFEAFSNACWGGLTEAEHAKRLEEEERFLLELERDFLELESGFPAYL